MNHHSFRSLIGAGMACAALTVSAVAVAAPAGAADTGGTGARHHRVHLTDEQKQCMNDHGITRPVRPLTPEKIAAIKASDRLFGIS